MEMNIRQMGYQFEDRENLRNTAKDILKRQGVSNGDSENIMDQTIFDYTGSSYANAQRAILKASSQLNINSSLKETLKYLKSHIAKKAEKEPVFGELWDLFNKKKSTSNEIIEFEIDYSAKNIFAA